MFTDVHRFAVSDVKISVDANLNSTKNNAPNQYSVLVNFNSPRGSNELFKKYPIFIYKVWRVTNGNAALVALGKIEKNQFSVPRLEKNKFYFVRIFTIINNAFIENYSTLKFFTNHYPSIPAIQIQTLTKHPNISYSLALNLDMSTPRNEIKYFIFIVEKNNKMIERRRLEKDTKQVMFNILFESMADYALKVYTVFNTRIASEYSVQKFFQFPKNIHSLSISKIIYDFGTSGYHN
ncbi:unnamed protein product [Gordionus sp. m RMFG-2023]